MTFMDECHGTTLRLQLRVGAIIRRKGAFCTPYEDRAITLREAALLQSFPQTYLFPLTGGKEAIALMIGNALPPEFVRRHALEVRKALSALVPPG